MILHGNATPFSQEPFDIQKDDGPFAINLFNNNRGRIISPIYLSKNREKDDQTQTSLFSAITIE